MSAVGEALAVFEAATARLESITRRRVERDQDGQFRTLVEALDHAKANLVRVAGRHTLGEATDEELDAARQEYRKAEADDRLHQIEWEGLKAAENGAETAVASSRRALDLAVSGAAVALNRSLEDVARDAALTLRHQLLRHRALSRIANAAVAPNDVIPRTISGETRFQASLRSLIFDPASPDETITYGAHDLA